MVLKHLVLHILPNLLIHIDHVILSFGKDRVCFGSDWPVCELAATYEESIQIVEQKLDSFTAEEAEGFWGGVATKFYGLK